MVLGCYNKSMSAIRHNRSGFTIVELLIVIVVIGILAAITIVAYNGIQTRAKLSSLQSDIRNAVPQLENIKATTGAYPADVSSLQKSPSTTFTYTPINNGYCIDAKNATSDIGSFFSTNLGLSGKGPCPVGYWPLDGSPQDASPYAALATPNGIAPAADRNGQANQAYQFAGNTSSYIDTGKVYSLENFTFSLWVYQTVNGTYQTPLSETRDCCGTGYHGFELETSYTSNNAVLKLWKADGTSITTQGANTDLNTWDFFAGSFDGTNLRLYKNGQLVSTNSSYTGAVGTPTATLKIGEMGVSGAGAFGGSIDDVRLYDHALSATEIKQLYDAR